MTIYSPISHITCDALDDCPAEMYAMLDFAGASHEEADLDLLQQQLESAGWSVDDQGAFYCPNHPRRFYCGEKVGVGDHHSLNGKLRFHCTTDAQACEKSGRVHCWGMMEQDLAAVGELD